jgi:pSer/pThr/pTyr-binding forkhead associated (FHA) protein
VFGEGLRRNGWKEGEVSVQLKNPTALLQGSLEQMSGPDKGRLFELSAARLTLGRSAENDIVLDLEGVSRVHALLVHSEDAWFIRDNNSKNGIFVNGEKVKESWLETGDMVQLGTFIFRFNAGPTIAMAPEGNLPDLASPNGAMDLGAVAGMGMAPVPTATSAGRRAGNPRILIYVGVLALLGGYLMLGGSSSEPGKSATDGEVATASGGERLSRDFSLSEKPKLDLGTKQVIPLGMEDPMLKKAEQEMTRLDWSNTSLREAEQFFRRGQREYLNRNFHRAIDSFRTALSLYGGHVLAERYLRRAVYEAEIEAKNNMASAIQYYESLQYARAIHHFNEAIALLAHRPNEPMVKEAQRYIKQAELRLQAAELFP